MTIPTGTGFYIWQLPTVLPISRTIEALQRAKASWVSIKVADGIYKSNQVRADGGHSGNDEFLLEFIAALRAEGISVGGWQFIYPLPTLSPGAQAGVVGERWQKLDLDHFLIDGEQVTSVGAYWMFLADGTLNPQRRRSAETYMNQLRPAGIPLSGAVALSSYRWPTLQGPFPFEEFVNHASSKFVAPQMYWVGAHNPREQLERSIAEYSEIREVGAAWPMVPIGAAFGAGSWEPTEADLMEFVDAAQDFGCPGWGFWSLDWILAKNKMGWLDAIAGSGSPPPPPPPPPPATTPERVRIVGLVGDETLRMRAEIFGAVVAKTWNGCEFAVMSEDADYQGRAWYQVGESIWIASWYTEAL